MNNTAVNQPPTYCAG